MKPSPVLTLLITVFCIFLLSSCTSRLISVNHTEIALGTYVKLIIVTKKGDRYGAQEAIDDVYALMNTFEGDFDYRDDDGELARFNRGTVLLREENSTLFTLLEQSLGFSQLTDGYFDPTVLPLTQVWGFDGGSPGIPKPEDLEEALQRIGYQYVSITDDRIEKPVSVRFDLSGIAKGKIVDLARDYLRSAGFDDFLVDAGGDIYVSGRNLDRMKWRVAIQDPVHRDSYSGIVEKSNAAIVTSGDYENFFIHNGKRYSHLFNPFTGFPDSDVKSVTIVSDETTSGDALATAVFTMGSSEGFQFLLEHGIEGYIIYDSGDDIESLSTPRFWD